MNIPKLYHKSVEKSMSKTAKKIVVKPQFYVVSLNKNTLIKYHYKVNVYLKNRNFVTKRKR